MTKIRYLSTLLLSCLLLLGLAACGDTAQTAPDSSDLKVSAVSDYDLETKTVKTWNGGYMGTLTLTNKTSDVPATAFKLELSFPQAVTLDRLWGGVTEDTGPTYVINSPKYLDLKKGETHEIGFVIRGSQVAAQAKILSVNGSGTDPTDPPPNPDPPNPDPDLPAPVYESTFDALVLGRYQGEDDLEVVACGERGKCLAASYLPSEKGSARLDFKEKLPAAQEYTLTYDVRFEDGFEWVKGGKLPGLTAASSVTGCNVTEDDGWSARLMWRRAGRLSQYLYHQDKEERCGEDVYADEGDFRLEQNRWYRFSLYVKVNSSASARDGQVALYVDGQEVARREDLRLRNVDEGGLIEQFYFSSFYGGNDPSWAPTQTTYITFDNFIVRPGLSVPGKR